MTGRAPLIIASFAVLGLAADSAAAEFPDKAGVVQFSTPSENIQCSFIAKPTATYTPKDGAPELSCDRANPIYVRITIGGAKGTVTRIDNPPDQSCCSAEHVLKAGDHWKGGPFSCVSDANGLTCRHENGHGLFLSLKAIRTN